MVTGELDYSSIFGLSYEVSNVSTMESNMRNIKYPEMASFVWIVFLILIPILLSNMLVSNGYDY